MDDPNESTLSFLQALDARHSQILDDLDALNARIEAVLGEYNQSRNHAAGGEAACDNSHNN
jgi:uncharacterized protein YdcH (DUF465 family)